MQIVIDIPEEEYQNILLTGKASFCTVNAIEAGTPLPEGHGRLVDAKEVYKKFYCRCLAGVAYEVLNETSTIIPEDKEKEE